VRGEATFRVPSLAVPDPHTVLSLDDLLRVESIQLFVERARAATPTFYVTESTALALIQIRQRLDGIPLAIELAAAQVRVLTVEQIAARLDDRFRLLTVGSRTAMRRRPTLRALADWSHDLLLEADRILSCRLAVFAGGWTQEVAEGTCAGDGIDASEVLDLLTSLVNKSLVVAEGRFGRALSLTGDDPPVRAGSAARGGRGWPSARSASRLVPDPSGASGTRADRPATDSVGRAAHARAR
jgi:predicted ATPase